MTFVQIETSTGHTINSGNTYTVIDVDVPAGRLAVGGGFDKFRTNGFAPRAELAASYPLDADTWRFVFWNASGNTDTVSVYVTHIPDVATVEVYGPTP